MQGWKYHFWIGTAEVVFMYKGRIIEPNMLYCAKHHYFDTITRINFVVTVSKNYFTMPPTRSFT